MSEPRLFDPERYSTICVSVFLSLPESNARAFVVASALGSTLDGDGTTNVLKSAKESSGVLISKKRAALVREVLSIGDRHWRRLLHDWTTRQVAHRCGPGVVVLFARPFLEECPSCHQEIVPTKMPAPREVKPRGRSFGRTTSKESGRTTSKESGRITSAKRRYNVRGGGATTSAFTHGSSPP